MFRISRYVAAAGLLLAAVAWGNEDRYENTIHANVTYHGGKVQIDHKFGRVEVRTTGGGSRARGVPGRVVCPRAARPAERRVA